MSGSMVKIEEEVPYDLDQSMNSQMQGQGLGLGEDLEANLGGEVPAEQFFPGGELPGSPTNRIGSPNRSRMGSFKEPDGLGSFKEGSFKSPNRSRGGSFLDNKSYTRDGSFIENYAEDEPQVETIDVDDIELDGNNYQTD